MNVFAKSIILLTSICSNRFSAWQQKNISTLLLPTVDNLARNAEWSCVFDAE